MQDSLRNCCPRSGNRQLGCMDCFQSAMRDKISVCPAGSLTWREISKITQVEMTLLIGENTKTDI